MRRGEACARNEPRQCHSDDEAAIATVAVTAPPEGRSIHPQTIVQSGANNVFIQIQRDWAAAAGGSASKAAETRVQVFDLGAERAGNNELEARAGRPPKVFRALRAERSASALGI
jgi:hypothetical protein